MGDAGNGQDGRDQIPHPEGAPGPRAGDIGRCGDERNVEGMDPIRGIPKRQRRAGSKMPAGPGRMPGISRYRAEPDCEALHPGSAQARNRDPSGARRRRRTWGERRPGEDRRRWPRSLMNREGQNRWMSGGCQRSAGNPADRPPEPPRASGRNSRGPRVGRSWKRSRRPSGRHHPEGRSEPRYGSGYGSGIGPWSNNRAIRWMILKWRPGRRKSRRGNGPHRPTGIPSRPKA